MKISYSKYLILFALLGPTISLADNYYAYTIKVENQDLYHVYNIDGVPKESCSDPIFITSTKGDTTATWKVWPLAAECPFWAYITLTITDALSKATLGTITLKGYPGDPLTLAIDSQNLPNAFTATQLNNSTIKLTFAVDNGSKQK